MPFLFKTAQHLRYQIGVKLDSYLEGEIEFLVRFFLFLTIWIILVSKEMSVLESNAIVPAKWSGVWNFRSAWFCCFRIKHMLASHSSHSRAKPLKIAYFRRFPLEIHIVPDPQRHRHPCLSLPLAVGKIPLTSFVVSRRFQRCWDAGHDIVLRAVRTLAESGNFRVIVSRVHLSLS